VEERIHQASLVDDDDLEAELLGLDGAGQPGRGSALGLGSVSGTDSVARILGMYDRTKIATPSLAGMDGKRRF